VSKSDYPEFLTSLMALTGSPLLLLEAVISNYRAMPEPGAEDVITFPGPRRALVNNVAVIYSQLAGVPTYKFPFSEAAVIDMHTKFRKLTGERKTMVLNHLNFK